MSYFLNLEKVRVFYDSKEKLLGLKPSARGYTIDKHRYNIHVTPLLVYNIPDGSYEAEWDTGEHMIVADLTKCL